MRTMRKILALLLALFMAASFAACVGDVDTDPLDESVIDLNKSDVESEDVSVKDPEPAEGQTAMPVVKSVFNNSATSVVISGTCEENAVITSTGVGLSTTEVNAKGTDYVIEIDLGINATATVRLTATAEGKTESDIREVRVEDAQGLQGNLVAPVVLADKFVFFSEESLGVLSNQSVSYTKTDALITQIKGINTGDGDTELIYVLAPSRAKVLADKLPAELQEEISTVSLYKQTVKALSDAGVTVIDLEEAFAEADDYPLFYDTHGGWSDYAAFIAYTEIMNYISEKFPDAAPHGMDQFDVNTVEDALLGDLAYNYGLDINLFNETVYDFVPKFDLDMGKEYAVNTQKAPGEDSELVDEESSAEELEEEVSSELDSEFLEKFSLISDIKVNLYDNDFRFYNSEFADEYYDENDVVVPTTNDSELCFATNREELYLPSALIYRASDTAPIIPMLAERFRNSMFYRANSYSVNGTYASSLAGTPDNSNVDYIIVLLTEEEIASIYAQ